MWTSHRASEHVFPPCPQTTPRSIQRKLMRFPGCVQVQCSLPTTKTNSYKTRSSQHVRRYCVCVHVWRRPALPSGASHLLGCFRVCYQCSTCVPTSAGQGLSGMKTDQGVLMSWRPLSPQPASTWPGLLKEFPHMHMGNMVWLPFFLMSMYVTSLSPTFYQLSIYWGA